MRLGGRTSYEADLEWTAVEARREGVEETWLVTAPTRYQALKIARRDAAEGPALLLSGGVPEGRTARTGAN